MKPTNAELKLAIMKDYHGRFGPRRLLSLHYRSSRRGAWAEKKLVYCPSQRRHMEKPKLEHDLRVNRRAMFDPVFGKEQRGASSTIVDDCLNLLPDQWFGLNDAEISKVADELLMYLAMALQPQEGPVEAVQLITHVEKAA